MSTTITPSHRATTGQSTVRRRTAWRALTGNPLRFLLGVWPWRALAYALVSAAITALLLAGQLVSVVLAPVLGLAVAAVERRRVVLLGYERIPSAHVRIPFSNGRSWIRVRATEAATWRDAANLAVSMVIGLPLVVLFGIDLYAVAFGVAFFVAPDVLPLGPLESQMLADAGGRYGGVAIAVAAAAALLYLVIHSYVATALAVAQARLSDLLLSPRQEELEAHVARLSASREALVAAFESERLRIERDLHDGAQQRLVALSISLGLAEIEARRVESDHTSVAPILAAIAEARTHAEEALAELRRTVRGVRPPVLDDHGLRAAVDELASRTPIPVTLLDDTVFSTRFTTAVETCAYFFVSEALTNAMRHSAADNVGIALEMSASRLIVVVSDDGRGGAATSAGSGLTGLEERAAVLGGTTTIVSPIGGPTSVTLSLPISGHSPSQAQ